MIRLVVVLLVLSLCTGATCERRPDPPPREATKAVPVGCDAICTATCLPAQWPQWAGNPDDPATWDRIGGDVVDPLRAIAEHCNAARGACVQCLRRAERIGAICGATTEGPCGEQ